MIKGLRTALKKQGARRDAAVIGNIVHLRNKQDRAQWWTHIAWSRKGVGQGEFDLIGLNCGFCADDPKAKDAKAMREEMIAELKRYFKAVHVCANEVEQAHKLVELWPGEKAVAWRNQPSRITRCGRRSMRTLSQNTRKCRSMHRWNPGCTSLAHITRIGARLRTAATCGSAIVSPTFDGTSFQRSIKRKGD